jgi:hypothetical protein
VRGSSSKAAYHKLIDAVDAYDDSIPESGEVNQTLVKIASEFPAEAINMAPARGDPALVVAARQQKLGAAMVLMYSGASADVKDREGRTLLHVVLSAGSNANVELAAMFVGSGQSLDDVSAFGRTVLENLANDGLVKELHQHLSAGTVPVQPEIKALCRRLEEHLEATEGVPDNALDDEIERLINEHEAETAAAICIQSGFRGFRERREMAARSRPSSFGSTGQAPQVQCARTRTIPKRLP